MWQAFLLITVYLVFVAVCVYAFTALGNAFAWKWGVPFAIGVVLWLVSAILFAVRAQGTAFRYCALFVSALACGLLITAYAVGKQVTVHIPSLLALAGIASACFLVFMAFLTPYRLAAKPWYIALCSILFVGVCITAGVCCAPLFANTFQNATHAGMFFLFFLLLVGVLGFGALAPAENFAELTAALVTPAILVTCGIGIIVLIALICGDGDCDCADCGISDCCDCTGNSKGNNPTVYNKKKKTTMSGLSAP